ncbi:MAG: DUF3182 family protein [Rhodospirillaceae bacterium]
MPQRRKIVCHAVGGSCVPPGHEDITRTQIAKQIAALLASDAGGDYDPGSGEKAPDLYFVPSETLTKEHAERDLGIASELDLFGGVVPHAYIATKIITHPLPSSHAVAPDNWSTEFGSRVAGVVLPGYSAFAIQDALDAAAVLLERGPVRIKRVRETGGRGQFVASTMPEVKARLGEIDEREIGRYGVVLELNLDQVKTLSVGQIRVGHWIASYYGIQRLTPDHHGDMVYGGSQLFVVRGDMDALLARDLPHEVRTALEQARVYDAAANACFDGFYASRRNYDIAQGVDTRGQPYSGVLEQSWRIGGASTAEICALQAFAKEPRLEAIRATCTEICGPCRIPDGATLYYAGDDPRVGYITKYAIVERL